MTVPTHEQTSEFDHWGPEIDLFWEDFTVGQVHQLGAHLITAEEIVDFGRRFDPQPFHVDPELARHSMFQGLVASGWHSAAIWMRLYWDGLLFRAASLVSPGADELHWLAPVRPGDELRGSFEIISVRPSRSRPDRGLVQARAELTDADGVVKLRMTVWGLFGRRPVPASR
ncbi:MAG TPA: MaoC family dehydratase [Candidatus Dormibacteraeota bacterium]|nr:MaoC family dehydratase [Candidatus Dormibacteraeota bacterium]